MPYELHRFDHGFYEGDFFIGEMVFGVELSVDFLHTLAPVDVAAFREVLQRNKTEFISNNILSKQYCSNEETYKLRSYIL